MKSIRKVESVEKIQLIGYRFAALIVVQFLMDALIKDSAMNTGTATSNLSVDPVYSSHTPDFFAILPANFNHYKQSQG